MIFIDVAFFAAIAPLLPEYADTLGLNKAEAGILSAAYAAGTLLGSLPAGYVASRMGPRKTVIHGLILLGVASLVFGFGKEILLLDAARFIQGIAGALIWSGALTWLITAAPEERRGSIIGSALGAAVEATLAPLAGWISDRVGRRLPYVTGLAVCAVAMVAIATVTTLGGVIAGLIFTSLGAGLCFAPALTLISDTAEASKLHQGF